MRYYEDFEVGEVLEFGGHKMTKEEIVDFAQRYDPQTFHVDEEAAKTSIYGELTAAGLHVAALMLRMWHFDGPESASEGSPGWDDIRWLKTVVPGDTLRVRAKIAEKRRLKSRPHIGVLKIDQTILNQRGEAVTTMRTSWFMRLRDPSAE